MAAYDGLGTRFLSVLVNPCFRSQPLLSVLVNLVFELCELGSLYDVIPVHGKVRLVHAAVRRSPHCVSWMLRMHAGLGLGTAPPHGTVWG